jgi:hypothetical protein
MSIAAPGAPSQPRVRKLKAPGQFQNWNIGDVSVSLVAEDFR